MKQKRKCSYEKTKIPGCEYCFKEINCSECKRVRKEGWVAALKWALTHKHKVTDAQFQCEAPVEMIQAYILEEELEAIEE
jgi:hypothetical protein